MIRRCKGFLTLKEKPFEMKFALQVYSENHGTCCFGHQCWPSRAHVLAIELGGDGDAADPFFAGPASGCQREGPVCKFLVPTLQGARQ